MSPMYSAAPNADAVFSSRNTVNDLFAGSPVAFMLNASYPTTSVVRSTLIFTLALGMHAANWAEEGESFSDTDGATYVVAAAAGAGVALTLAPVNAPATIAPAARMPAAHRVLVRIAGVVLSHCLAIGCVWQLDVSSNWMYQEIGCVKQLSGQVTPWPLPARVSRYVG